jgi:hypothetical protein
LTHSPNEDVSNSTFLSTLREELLTKLASKELFLPSFKDFRIPVLSSVSDSPLSRSFDGSLVETIVEAILSEPISLLTVASAFSATLPGPDSAVRVRLFSFAASSQVALAAGEEEGVHERVVINELSGGPLLCSKQ